MQHLGRNNYWLSTSHMLLQAVKQETMAGKYENIERVDVRFRQLSNLKCSCIEANSNFSSVFKNTELSNQAYDTTAQTSVRGTQRLFSVKLPFRRSKFYCLEISKVRKVQKCLVNRSSV